MFKVPYFLTYYFLSNRAISKALNLEKNGRFNAHKTVKSGYQGFR